MIFKQVLIPIIFFAAIAPFTPAIDIALSSYFYHGEVKGFPSSVLFDAITVYGVYPALLTFYAAVAMFVFSYSVKSFQKWRKHLLLLILTMVIGAGLITHVILKDHWERPRPKQTELFGGSKPFRAFYEPDISLKIGSHKSFPCGHCTMGFYFFAVALIGKRLHNRPLFWFGISFALILGFLLSLARIAQGGHYFSDTLASALIMWLIALGCDWLIYTRRRLHK
jgi:lipid A 4'-phosphatase